MKEIEKNSIVRKTVSLPQEQWDKIEKEAERKNFTQARIIREIIDMYFEEINKEDN